MSNTILNLQNVGKCYTTYRSNLARFLHWFGVPTKPESEYWAVKELSFELKSGEALALIGQNGAGKSTLLKLITGTVRPNAGNITVNGRISAILELGLGFNPEFTGRQNVRLSAGMMGLSTSEIEDIMLAIEDFSELGEFFDQPLRVYSSGMQARLAFSVATAVRPDVLIVDEVLSVGDSYFQHKSFDKIRQFKEEGTTILFVTHSMGDVRALCDRVILLDKGTVMKDGLPDEVVDYYNAMIAEKENKKLSIEQKRRKDGWLLTEFGTREAIIEKLELKDAETDNPVQIVNVGQEVAIETRICIQRDIKNLVLGHRITDRTGHVIWGTNTWHTKQILKDLKEGQVVLTRLTFGCTLGPGSYSICFGLHESDTHLEACYHKADNAIVFDVVNSDKTFFIGSTWLKSNFELNLS